MVSIDETHIIYLCVCVRMHAACAFLESEMKHTDVRFPLGFGVMDDGILGINEDFLDRFDGNPLK